MDPIDILGGLLGGGKSSSGAGGSVFSDIFKSGRKSPPPSRTSAPSLEQQAKELEDMLGVAKDSQGGAAARPPQAQPRYRQPPSYEETGRRYQDTTSIAPPQPAPAAPPKPVSMDEEVVVLIRAMITAAKADGRITQDEQQSIMGRIKNPSQQAMQFLREEFSRQVDVREFAWSVPLGMEQKVYMMTLAAIKIDSQAESAYLRDLAHGLRLTPEACNEIHTQFGLSPVK